MQASGPGSDLPQIRLRHFRGAAEGAGDDEQPSVRITTWVMTHWINRKH
ncbi:hypothetical protein OMCYN_01494 [cyanobiont of Ornithocercus magnificus]|nr:hypothetical protein OMCYN_01494 [cyanobiont of Ornithocercus magnificus]